MPMLKTIVIVIVVLAAAATFIVVHYAISERFGSAPSKLSLDRERYIPICSSVSA
jgi:hypothetical protein